jgi:hypothetical protein
MNKRPTAIERAFQLAKSGRYASTGHLRKALETEGYSKWQVDGPSLLKQLRELIQGSRDPRGSEAEERPAKPRRQRNSLRPDQLNTENDG